MSAVYIGFFGILIAQSIQSHIINIAYAQDKDARPIWPMAERDLKATNRSYYDGTPYLTVLRKHTFDQETHSSSPVIGSDGTIYVLFEKPTKLAAYKDGKLLWKYVGSGNGGQRGAPALDSEGNVYFTDWEDNVAKLISLDSQGNVRFKRGTNTHGFSSTWNSLGELITLQNDSILGLHGYSYYYQLVTKDNKWWKDRESYVNHADGSLAGWGWIEYNRASVDSKGNIYTPGISGFKKYKFDTAVGDYVQLYMSGPSGKGSIVISDDDSTIYRYNNYDGTIYALNAEDGSVIWSHKIGVDWPWTEDNGASLTHKGNIFVTNGENWWNGDYWMYLFAPDGELLWKKEGFVGEPFISALNGKLYGNISGDTVALNESDGLLVWSYESGWKNNTHLIVTDSGWAVDPHYSYMYEYRPWTIELEPIDEYYKVGDIIELTVRTSMLKRDPTAEEDNRVQVVISNGDKVELEYSGETNEYTVWEGTYEVPPNIKSGELEFTAEAIAYKTTTDIDTHFNNLAENFNNTGITTAIKSTVDADAPDNSVAHTDFEIVKISDEKITDETKEEGGKKKVPSMKNKPEIKFATIGDGTSGIDRYEIRITETDRLGRKKGNDYTYVEDIPANAPDDGDERERDGVVMKYEGGYIKVDPRDNKYKLKEGREYYIKVRVYDKAGNYTDSEEVKVKIEGEEDKKKEELKKEETSFTLTNISRIRYDSAEDNYYYTAGNIVLKGRVDKLGCIHVYVDGDEYTKECIDGDEFNIPVSLIGGSHSIKLVSGENEEGFNITIGLNHFPQVIRQMFGL